MYKVKSCPYVGQKKEKTPSKDIVRCLLSYNFIGSETQQEQPGTVSTPI